MAESKKRESKQQEQANMPDFVLVVTEAFGDYRRGDRIEDPNAITEVLGTPQEVHCVRAAR